MIGGSVTNHNNVTSSKYSLQTVKERKWKRTKEAVGDLGHYLRKASLWPGFSRQVDITGKKIEKSIKDTQNC